MHGFRAKDSQVQLNLTPALKTSMKMKSIYPCSTAEGNLSIDVIEACHCPQFDLSPVCSRIKKYLDGDWEAARDMLTVVDKCVGQRMAKLCLSPDLINLDDVNEGLLGDGPSRTILSYMAKQGHTPPFDWESGQGRELTSK